MKATLKRYWGYDSFRPGQEEIISSALEGRDTLAILPTGGGKSICFQVPALMKEGICIVVSPLIALMKDQVQNLSRRGIQALAVHSGMTRHEIDTTLDNAVYGDYKFLYLSPERLRTRIFQTRLLKMNVNFLVVDEAHCISQWGYDFRPDYLEIARIRTALPAGVPVIALTATATKVVARDIMEKLSFRDGRLIQGDFARPNLSYVVRKTEDKMGQLLKICSSLAGSGVVYVSKRKNAENLAAFLCAHGIQAEGYHAGMDRDLRSQIQDRWKSDRTRIIVSTNAFGMGIDKPDVRFVCHFDMPDSLEGYFQEAGRAGRDSLRAYAVLLWNGADIRSLKQKVHTAFPPLKYIRDIYQKVFTYVGFAYEEGAGANVKFSLEDFARHFKLNATQAYYAIQYIGMSGYWTLSETLSIPSRIQFTVSRDDLYRIQLGSPEMDSFVKVLLRLYPGLFSEYVPIDIEKIAKTGRYSAEAVSNKLVSLAGKQIIKYIPSINSPMLSINNERLFDKNLRLPESEYRERLNRRLEHLSGIIDYVEMEKGCRSEYLLHYFGQDKTSACGTCDLCLSKNKTK